MEQTESSVPEKRVKKLKSTFSYRKKQRIEKKFETGQIASKIERHVIPVYLLDKSICKLNNKRNSFPSKYSNTHTRTRTLRKSKERQTNIGQNIN